MDFGIYEGAVESQDGVSFREETFETITAEIDALDDDLRQLNLDIHGAIRHCSNCSVLMNSCPPFRPSGIDVRGVVCVHYNYTNLSPLWLEAECSYDLAAMRTTH